MYLNLFSDSKSKSIKKRVNDIASHPQANIAMVIEFAQTLLAKELLRSGDECQSMKSTTRNATPSD